MENEMGGFFFLHEQSGGSGKALQNSLAYRHFLMRKRTQRALATRRGFLPVQPHPPLRREGLQ